MINLNKELRQHFRWTSYQTKNKIAKLVGRRAVVTLIVHDIDQSGHYITGAYSSFLDYRQDFVCHVTNSALFDKVSKGSKLKLTGLIDSITDDFHIVGMVNCNRV